MWHHAQITASSQQMIDIIEHVQVAACEETGGGALPDLRVGPARERGRRHGDPL